VGSVPPRDRPPDVIVVLYNGQAGWTRDPAGVGICHAELQRAWDLYPSKLRLIHLRFPPSEALGLKSPADVARQNRANREFAAFIDRMTLMAGQATDRESLEAQVRLAIAKAIMDLVALGTREGRRGRYHLGSPLDWSRLSYGERKSALERTVREYLRDAHGGTDDGAGLTIALAAQKVLCLVHDVPAGFGIAEARELVGRPHLQDHRTSAAGPRGPLGPLHVIACHRSCTESQIVAFMGHPDLFIVKAPFGYFVADEASFVQTFFLTDCRDSIATLLGLQRTFDWVEQSRERPQILRRGRSQARILRAIATEVQRSDGDSATRDRRAQ
jgi:hypothetical protein